MSLFRSRVRKHCIKKIAVIGTGYLRLVSGTCFAERGNTLTCIDRVKIDRLTQGEITIYEPRLEKMFLNNLRDGRLKFTIDFD